MSATFGWREKDGAGNAGPPKGDRRKLPRMQKTLHGRYLFAGRQKKPRQEHLCTLLDLSPGVLALEAAARGKVGDTVVVYFDGVGPVEGDIMRLLDDGFVLKLSGRSRAAAALREL